MQGIGTLIGTKIQQTLQEESRPGGKLFMSGPGGP